ncbi:hypothetical protein GCM10008119_22540 [Pedobacter mendelii]|uniref:Uncharacterized protein n=1 Tax=Pedobacter mendelii TaxID=1908240 RepID=A0ABQ2BLM2_9SPHI|nr:hypothetical protein GCM10008119_22540 [Pedobacter mendelii]
MNFRQPFKILLKKYKTLGDDLEVLNMTINAIPSQRPPFSFTEGNLGLMTCVTKIKKWQISHKK